MFVTVLNRMIREIEDDIKKEQNYIKNYNKKFTRPPGAGLWATASYHQIRRYEESQKNLNRLSSARNSLIKVKQAGPRVSNRNLVAEMFSPAREQKRGTFNMI
jgi:hypothetical protein